MAHHKTLLTQIQKQFLLGYPQLAEADLQARQEELISFQVEGFYSFGKQKIKSIQILGLGYVGLVVLVEKNQQNYAFKIRRTDAAKLNLDAEAHYLNLANTCEIGPKLYQSSPNFILMEHIVGQSFFAWLKSAIASPNLFLILKVIENLLEQAFQLDQIGLDRGDMNCITNDVIITPDNQPVIIDFSSASGDRQPKNLTSLVQGLFWGSAIAEYLTPIFPQCNQENLCPFLRTYKQDKSHGNFLKLKQQILTKGSKF